MKKRGLLKKIIKKKKGEVVKRIFFILRTLISIIIGFLPSFLFVALFVSYGSPFSTYIKFLLNLSASWGAWLAAFIIPSLIYFIGRAIKSRKDIKKVIKYKYPLLIFILSLLALLSLISVQLYLYINFTLRSDILVRLSADKNDIFFY